MWRSRIPGTYGRAYPSVKEGIPRSTFSSLWRAARLKRIVTQPPRWVPLSYRSSTAKSGISLYLVRDSGGWAKTSSGRSPNEACSRASASVRKAVSSSSAGPGGWELAISHVTARSKSARAEQRPPAWSGKGPGRKGHRGPNYCRLRRATARARESPRRAGRPGRGPDRGFLSTCCSPEPAQ